jgi:myo-inositol-1(or 4)-monophosphatase
MDLQATLNTATGIIQQAGAMARDYFERPHTIENKTSVFDVVTEADKAVEVLLKKALSQAFPDHHIVGEESGGSGAATDEAEYFWYIDPIDGTSNFSHHIPTFAVSMGLANRDMNPLLGLVLNPVSGELLSGIKGQGATLNGRPIQVASTDSLAQAIFATGFPYDPATKRRINVKPFLALLPITLGIRRTGSAALDLSYVACGRFDGYWELRLKPWDCMAGILLVREAGGCVTDFQGGDSSLNGREIIASNGHLHEALREIIVSNSG